MERRSKSEEKSVDKRESSEMAESAEEEDDQHTVEDEVFQFLDTAFGESLTDEYPFLDKVEEDSGDYVESTDIDVDEAASVQDTRSRVKSSGSCLTVPDEENPFPFLPKLQCKEFSGRIPLPSGLNKRFRKVKSATFKLDGMNYMIGR